MGMLSYGGARGTGLGASRIAEEYSVLGCRELPGSWGAAAASSRGAGVPGYRGAGVNGAEFPGCRRTEEIPGCRRTEFPDCRSTEFPRGAGIPGT